MKARDTCISGKEQCKQNTKLEEGMCLMHVRSRKKTEDEGK
jgi:hypothetical protein